MRIPQVFFESLLKKHPKMEPQLIEIRDLIEQISEFKGITNLHGIRTLMDAIDEYLEAAVISLYDVQNSNPEKNLSTVDGCLKIMNFLQESSGDIQELFFSIDHLINLVYIIPSVVNVLHVLLPLSPSKLSRFKVDLFEKQILRFLYINQCFQKGVQNQSDLFDIQRQEMTFKIPCDEMLPYNTYIEQLQIKKIISVPQKEITITPTKENPWTQTNRICTEYGIQKDCLLFDMIFSRVVCESLPDNIIKEQYISNYMFQTLAQGSDLYNVKVLQDISNRGVDQKDYLVQILRLIERENSRVALSGLKFMIQRQHQLDGQSSQTLQNFQLRIIQETLMYYAGQDIPDTCPPWFEGVKYPDELETIIFRQLSDTNNCLRKAPQPWIHLVLWLLREQKLSQPLCLCLMMFIQTLIQDGVDYHLEIEIIQTLLTTQSQVKKLQIFNNIVLFYKQEYDQVSMQNAQSEIMVPVPERFHKLLGFIWDNHLLDEFNDNENLLTPYVSLLSLALGEFPARVREFVESEKLSKLLKVIATALKSCAKQFIVLVINLLISIATNEKAMQMALFEEQLVEIIFEKSFDQDITEEFSKKIIMLYSQNKIAKQQIEKVIESTFVHMAHLVDLSKEKIEGMVEDKLKHFYPYSKTLQSLLQLFSQLQPQKRSYRNYQGYEDMQQEETAKQKDMLFNSLLKNPRFVEALERIIMSPILIGSKNKDHYVESYVTILYKKNKFNPIMALIRELDLIQESYMMIDNVKVIDISRLVDYKALSAHMSERYFFRKIIKHISPKTYRGFYIMSRFHLIHYLIKMVKQQGARDLPNIQVLICQLLEIFFLSSQHAGFHEEIIMCQAARQVRGIFEEESQLKRKISKDNLIPLQSSCLELISQLQTTVSLEQRESIVQKYGEIILLFISQIEIQSKRILELPDIEVLGAVTYAQDMLKSLKHLVKAFLTIENQFHPLSFILQLQQQKLIGLVAIVKNVEKKKESIKILPGFQDAIIQHVDALIKDLFFRKIMLDKVTFQGVVISDPLQLELICNEAMLALSSQILDMINELWSGGQDSRVILQSLIQKYVMIREMSNPEIKQYVGTQLKEQQLAKDKELYSFLQQVESKRQEQKKQTLFERPEVKMVLDMVVNDMGFSERLARKAIRKIEIPEPTMIIDMLINGKVSDDEDEEPIDDSEEFDKSNVLIHLVQQSAKKQQEIQEEQAKQTIIPIDQEKFFELLGQRFTLERISLTERCQQRHDAFRNQLDQMLSNCIQDYTPEKRSLVEYLLSLQKKPQPLEIIIKKILDENSLEWLSILQTVFPSQHEALYSHKKLIDQEDPPLTMTFQSLIARTQKFNADSFELCYKDIANKELWTNRSDTLRFLLRELVEVAKYLQKFCLNNQQAHEQIVERYWGQILMYIHLLIQILDSDQKLQVLIIELIDKSPNENRLPLQKRLQLDRLLPLMQVLNNYALHNQNNVYSLLMEQQVVDRSLLEVLYSLRYNQDEDSYVFYLENLLYLLALDETTIQNLVTIQLKMAIALDHGEWYVQQSKVRDSRVRYLEASLNQLMTVNPILMNSPWANLPGFTVTSKFTELNRTFNTKSAKKEATPDLVLRYDTAHQIKYSLNANFVKVVDQIVDLIFARMQSETRYICSSEWLLRVLENLVLRVPTLTLYLRKRGLVQFLVQHLSWSAPEKLFTFLTNYLAEVNIISFSAGAMIASEILVLLVNEIKLDINDTKAFYHSLQILSLLTQLLTQQSFAYACHKSNSVIKLLVAALKNSTQDLPQMHRLLVTVVFRTLEPFMQNQVFYSNLRPLDVSDPLAYDYWRLTSNFLISQKCPLSQHIISFPQAQQSLVEANVECVWPPNMTKRIINQQRPAVNQQDEDVSDSGSDQDLNIQYKTAYANFPYEYYENSDFFPKYQTRDERDERRPEAVYPWLINFDIRFAGESTFTYPVPEVEIVPASYPKNKHSFYAVLSQYFVTNEYFESKKALLSKCYEHVIKLTVEFLGDTMRLLVTKNKSLESWYLNGTLHGIQYYFQRFGYYHQTSDYQASQIAISPQDSEFHQSKMLAQICCVQVQNRMLPSGCPVELQDPTIKATKITEEPNQEPIPWQSIHEEVAHNDEPVIDALVSLLDDMNRFPMHFIKSITKCQRIAMNLLRRLLSMIEVRNLELTLKILYIINLKIPGQTIRNLVQNALEVSPVLNRREKQNMQHVGQLVRESEFEDHDEEERHPILYLIELLGIYSQQTHYKGFHVTTPLLSQSTSLHQHYLTSIISVALSQEQQQIIPPKSSLFDKQKFIETLSNRGPEFESAIFQDLLKKSLEMDRDQNPGISLQQHQLQFQQYQMILLQKDHLEQQQPQEEEEPEPIPNRRKTSTKVSHLELEIISHLCKILGTGPPEIIGIINQFANDKVKIEHAIRELNSVLQMQAKRFNLELDSQRKALRSLNLVDHHQHQALAVISAINLPDPIVIQRVFSAMCGFLVNQIIKSVEPTTISKKSTATRQQIIADKKKHKLQQETSAEQITRKEIRKLFVSVLQTQQTHHLWLNVVETLLLVHNLKRAKVLDDLQRKLNPLLECFLRLYQNVSEEQTLLSQGDFFERNSSSSGQLVSMNTPHLQRTFSSLRDEGEMQLKVDELFTYLCVNGKRVINSLIANRLAQTTNLRVFKDQDPLGFVFLKMNQLISFENKKIFFEMELDALKAQDRPQKKRQEILDIQISRETRLQQSLEKVLSTEKNKFRKAEIKIRYTGEKGQDEGGIRKEWMTNLMKDILESPIFEINQKRFYKFVSARRAPEDLLIIKMLGRLLAKAIYDNQLVPAYLIPPIFRAILQQKLNFADLEHFNEGYYDTYLKFMNEDTDILYKDLFEFWVPEEYEDLLENQKQLIFGEIIQEHFDKQMPQVEEEEPMTEEQVIAKRKRKRQERGKIKMTAEQLQSFTLKDLIANVDIPIPLKNKKLMCQALSKSIMQDEISQQLTALREGFFEILPKELFQSLEWRDLQKIVIGVPSVDVDDLQLNTEYSNYEPQHQTIIWFWEVLKSLSDSEKADFLMFATGSPLVPLGGFKNLRGPNALKKFTIVKDLHPDHLIKSHACFNRIDLPEYSTKEILFEKLHKSLKESGSGFDLS